ncbi:hypothetical protein ACQPW1_22985 [Nocardia sp. CA-128927]|uniref:hypothetical protein n=1 Tax=Nocardia sp. CA-128927 TaxID=3239975 RepID=UPI003D976D4A
MRSYALWYNQVAETAANSDAIGVSGAVIGLNIERQQVVVGPGEGDGAVIVSARRGPARPQKFVLDELGDSGQKLNLVHNRRPFGRAMNGVGDAELTGDAHRTAA